jgi:hypothetical protein
MNYWTIERCINQVCHHLTHARGLRRCTPGAGVQRLSKFLNAMRLDS